jgi:hypothetical protein
MKKPAYLLAKPHAILTLSILLNQLASANVIKFDAHDNDNGLMVPSFDKPIENITVKIGQEAVLPCFINNLGSNKVSKSTFDRIIVKV